MPKAPITFMFHAFFNSLARSRYLPLFSNYFSFILCSAGTAKSTILQIFFFSLIITRFGLLAEIRWSVCISKSYRSLCVSFSRTGAGLLLLLFHSLWVFHTSVSCEYFTKVRVTENLLRSPGLFSVFRLILTMPQSG